MSGRSCRTAFPRCGRPQPTGMASPVTRFRELLIAAMGPAGRKGGDFEGRCAVMNRILARSAARGRWTVGLRAGTPTPPTARLPWTERSSTGPAWWMADPPYRGGSGSPPTAFKSNPRGTPGRDRREGRTDSGPRSGAACTTRPAAEPGSCPRSAGWRSGRERAPDLSCANVATAGRWTEGYDLAVPIIEDFRRATRMSSVEQYVLANNQSCPPPPHPRTGPAAKAVPLRWPTTSPAQTTGLILG